MFIHHSFPWLLVGDPWPKSKTLLRMRKEIDRISQRYRGCAVTTVTTHRRPRESRSTPLLPGQLAHELLPFFGEELDPIPIFEDA